MPESIHFSIFRPDRIEDPYFHDTEFFVTTDLQRVTNLVLPFLSMNAVTAKFSAVGITLGKTVQQLKEIIEEGELNVQNLFQLVLVVSSCFAMTFYPTFSWIGSEIMTICSQVIQLVYSVYENNPDQAFVCLVNIMKEGVYLASFTIATPELIILSTLLQIGYDTLKAYQNYKEEKLPEVLVQIILIAIRTFVLHSSISSAQKKSLVKNIESEAEFLELFEKAKSNPKRPFKSFLKKQNISSVIQGLSFSETSFESMNFSGITFKNCHFDHCSFQELVAKETHFINSHFTSCRFSNVRILKSLFCDSFFVESVFEEASLYGCWFKKTKFLLCNFNQTYFNNSFFEHSLFDTSKLFETIFLHVQADHSKIINCDLTDTILCDAKNIFELIGNTEPTITRPVVALTWDFVRLLNYTRFVKEGLHNHDLIVLPFMYNPESVDLDIVREETDHLIESLPTGKENLNVVQELLKRIPKNSELEKIEQMSDEVFRHVDAIVIGGGTNIDSKFYGKDEVVKLDHRRTYFEQMLINKQKEDPSKFMLLICRGAQAQAINHGYQLRDLGNKDHWGTLQTLNQHDSSEKDWKEFLSNFKDFQVQSNHKQAVANIGEPFEVVFSTEDVPKGWITKGNPNIFALQVHPEYYVVWLKNFHLFEEEAQNIIQKNPERVHEYLEAKEQFLKQIAMKKSFFELLAKRAKVSHELRVSSAG